MIGFMLGKQSEKNIYDPVAKQAVLARIHEALSIVKEDEDVVAAVWMILFVMHHEYVEDLLTKNGYETVIGTMSDRINHYGQLTQTFSVQHLQTAYDFLTTLEPLLPKKTEGFYCSELTKNNESLIKLTG